MTPCATSLVRGGDIDIIGCPNLVMNKKLNLRVILFIYKIFTTNFFFFFDLFEIKKMFIYDKFLYNILKNLLFLMNFSYFLLNLLKLLLMLNDIYFIHKLYIIFLFIYLVLSICIKIK